jgi:hypothetical protein
MLEEIGFELIRELKAYLLSLSYTSVITTNYINTTNILIVHKLQCKISCLFEENFQYKHPH